MKRGPIYDHSAFLQMGVAIELATAPKAHRKQRLWPFAAPVKSTERSEACVPQGIPRVCVCVDIITTGAHREGKAPQLPPPG